MSQISISIPKNLVDQIDKMAEAENRNRSNFIVTTLAYKAREFDSKESKNGAYENE
jgi:metal-responsive CopG/Arc/MetJ family transcriptional regulator